MPDWILTSMMKERIDMRKSLWLAAALLGALAAAGCQSEMMEPEQISGTKTLKVIAESDETRTYISPDENGKYKTYWSQDNEVVLVEMVNDVPSGDSYDFLKPYEPVNKSVDETGRTAIFNYELKAWQNLPENPVFRYMGVYPANAIQDFVRAGDVEADQWGLFWGEEFTSNDVMIMGEIPAEQSPSSDSFDPACDVLVSKVIEKEEQPAELRFSFARIGSIAKITLKGLPPGYYVTSGTFAHGESWQGTGDFVYNTQLERMLPLDEFVAELYGDQYEAEPITFQPQGVQVNDAGEAVIWLRTLSGKLTDWFSIDVALSPDGETPSYRKVSKRVELGNKSITFREGAITAFSVTLDGQSPIAFDEETTLKFFPELANGDQAVIRIPKDYSPEYGVAGWSWDYGYPLFFDSYVSLRNVSISFPYGYTDEDEWISVQEQDGGYYLKVDSNTSLPETATLVFTPDDPDISPIEIPIEGFGIITMKKDGYYVDMGDLWRDMFMFPGQTSTFTAEIRLPAWLEMVPDSFRWTVEDSNGESVSHEEGPDNSVLVTAEDERLIYVTSTINYTDHLTETVREYDNSIWVDVYPRSIPLKWNGVDWNRKTLMLTYGETVKIQADLDGISTENISRIDWSPNTNYGYLEIEESPDSYSVTIQAGSWEDSGSIELTVEMSDGTFYSSYCGVNVSPVMLKKKTGSSTWTRLYGDPIVLSPDGSCELEASIHPDSGYVSDEYTEYKPKWSVASNRYIDVHYDDLNGYKATVYAKTPGDDKVNFELWHQWGEYQHQTYLSLSIEYPVHVLLEDQ